MSAGTLTSRNSDGYAFFACFNACDHLSAGSNTSATEFTVPMLSLNFCIAISVRSRIMPCGTDCLLFCVIASKHG